MSTHTKNSQAALKKPAQKRNNRNRRKKTKVAIDTLNKKMGARGVDPRPSVRERRHLNNDDLAVTTQSPLIRQTCQMSYDSLKLLALSAVTRAVNKGFGIETAGGSPYHAWVALAQAFAQAATAATPSIQKAQGWYWELVNALTPKEIPFKTGQISYSWQVTGYTEDNFVFPPRFDLDASSFYMGTALSSPNVEGWVVLQDPAPYTDSLGKEALSNMWKYLGTEGLCKLVGEWKALGGDVSAFVSCYSEWGSGVGPGGIAVTVQSEVPITCPILARFAPYQDSFYRGSQHDCKSSGTVSAIVPKMLELESAYALRSKVSPVFKFYNFDWYYLILANICGSALELASRNNAQQAPVACPLTPMEVQLVLRQELMRRFCNDFAQDLYITGQTNVTMVPFTATPNGSFQTTSAIPSMLVPTVFAENVRAAYRITADVGSRNPRRKGKASTIDFIPILARPDPTVISQLGNFTYLDRDGNAQSVFSTDAYTNINLIDCSVVQGNDKVFLSIGGRNLADAIDAWNGWIKENLSANLTGLVELGKDKGIALLATVLNTTLCRTEFRTDIAPPPPNPVAISPTSNSAAKSLSKAPSNSKLRVGKSVAERLGVRAGMGQVVPIGTSDQYGFVCPKYLTSNQPITAPAWKYLSTFVQPMTIGQLGLNSENTLQFQQVFQCEPYSIAYSNTAQDTTANGAYVSLQQQAEIAAKMDIKTNLAAESEVEIELSQMAKEGRGGLFTGLARMFGNAIGIKGTDAVMNAVESLVDI